MNEEFNNNGQGELAGNSNNPNNTENFNSDSSNEENVSSQMKNENVTADATASEQSINDGFGENQNYKQNVYGNYTENNYENNMNNQTGSGYPYILYPTPAVNEERKTKKKKKVPGFCKLAAAALAFGIVAGAAFQGYFVVMNATGHSVDTGSSDIKISTTADKSGSGDAIATSASSSDTVVSDVSDVVDKVMPSIVAINAKVTSTSYDIFGRGESQNAESSGSGIIIAQSSSTLLIVTNNHVINGATSVEITFSDKSTTSAKVKSSDANSDLAVLSVDMSSLSKKTKEAIRVANLDSTNDVKAGDTAIAIGNALGYGQSVTVGVISAVNREVTIEDKTMKLLQTDAAINPGNSGGALLNTSGQVIGINSVKYADTEVEGMGYAIPISTALPMINELMNRETVSVSEQGYLGIDAQSAQEVTEDYSQRFNMPVGIYVNDIVENSPAEKAGLKQGDIITGIDDISVSTIQDLKNALSYKKAGEKIKLKIQVKQNGKYVAKTLNVTLGKKN